MAPVARAPPCPAGGPLLNPETEQGPPGAHSSNQFGRWQMNVTERILEQGKALVRAIEEFRGSSAGVTTMYDRCRPALSLHICDVR